MEAPKPGSATPSAPGTALRSEEAAPPDQDSVPGHNPTPQELVGESGQVPMDAYDSLAFSLDSAEPEGLEVFRNPTAYDSLPGQLLTTGERHGEEVPDDADKHEWLGVFINEDVCRIAPTRVQIERIPDPFGGGDDNGKQVKALVEGSVAFLVRDVEGLEAGHCVVEKNPWEYQTGGRFAIRHQGTSYLLAVTRHPSIRIRSEHGEAIPVLRVFLTRKDPGGDSTALILRLVGTEGFTIHWLGDFDGDGLLDLVLDDQGNYNAETTTLFLSRPAAPGRMLKRIASYTITGC